MGHLQLLHLPAVVSVAVAEQSRHPALVLLLLLLLLLRHHLLQLLLARVSAQLRLPLPHRQLQQAVARPVLQLMGMAMMMVTAVLL